MELALWLEATGRLSRILPQRPFIKHSLTCAWIFAAIALILVRTTYDFAPQQFIYFQF
jgi:uncharacterized membrane protein